jgi:hypothetical protein
MKHSLAINRTLAIIATFAIVVGFATVISAYQQPQQNPPAGNVLAPINVGSTTQLKQGPLSTAIGAPTGLFTNLFAIDYSSGTGKGIAVSANGAYILDGTSPVAGRVLTQGSDGRALWATGGTGSFPAGTNNQTIRYDGTTPVATGSVEVGSGGEVWMATLQHMPNIGPAREPVCALSDGQLVLCEPDVVQQGGGGQLQPLYTWQHVPNPLDGMFNIGTPHTCQQYLQASGFLPLNNDSQNVRARLSQGAPMQTGKCTAVGQNFDEVLVDYNQVVTTTAVFDSGNMEVYR